MDPISYLAVTSDDDIMQGLDPSRGAFTLYFVRPCIPREHEVWNVISQCRTTGRELSEDSAEMGVLQLEGCFRVLGRSLLDCYLLIEATHRLLYLG